VLKDGAMRYGAMNFPIKPVAGELEDIAAMGFDYLELTMDPPQAHYTTIRQQRNSILSALNSHSMSLICHLPTFVSTADLTDSIREASLEEMFNSMEVAAELGAQKVVLHPGHIGGLGLYVKETAMALLNESLASIIDRAQGLGLYVCLENMFPKCGAFVEPADFDDILNRFSDLRLTLDTGHANIGGRGGQRTLDFIKKFGPRIGHLHISDNSGERDDHLAVGSGVIDFLKIIRALKQCGYDDTATLEIFSDDRRELKKSRDRLEEMFAEA
jgi:sugar phosphate isomerase/epimerase